MKEIFDIRRFGALAWKFYRENAKTILIFLGMMIVVTFVVVCKFNPFKFEYRMLDDVYDEADYMSRFVVRFAGMFWGLLGFFSMLVAGYSFREVVSKKKSYGALLLPASSFEKVLLATLNATIVVVLVHLAVFYGTANFACSFKYGAFDRSAQVATEESWFGYQKPVLKEGEKLIRPKVGNVFYFVNWISRKSVYTRERQGENGVVREKRVYLPPFMVWNLLVASWTYFVFVFMWGAITFRKRSTLQTILLHLLFFLLLGWLTYKVGEAWCWNVPIEKKRLFGLNFYMLRQSFPLPSSYWLLFLYAVPLTYLGIIWKKFKNKQV